MIYAKLHPTEQGVMLAMCDELLIDRVLTDSKIEMNIRDYSEFYKGRLVSIKEAEKMLKADNICSINVVGKESIGTALNAGIITMKSVKKIESVPYAQAYKIDY